MNFLFFFVHPSKFHVFKHTINALIEKGHHVEVFITSKDVLEDLVKTEKWNYTNIFPEGRKMKGISPLISSTINLFRTIWRLHQHTKGKHYDLFITDDLLTFIGKLKKIPTIVFNDDDLIAVKPFWIILSMADYVLAPDITDLEKYNSKKIPIPSYKELAYLHPKYFKPDREILEEFNPELKPYSIIRIVLLRSYHDVGKKGISDKDLSEIIEILKKKGEVYIISERVLPKQFEKHRLQLNPEKIIHALAFAEIFVGDSQTMTSEATILGVPSFRCNDFVGKISVVDEKETRYKLSFNYLSKDIHKMKKDLEEFVKIPNSKAIYLSRREKLIEEKIDLTKFMIWYFENFYRINDHSKIDFNQFH